MISFLINLFICFWLFLAFSWNLPDDSFLKKSIWKIKPFIVWAGLWHSWSMFAPSPVQFERRVHVLLTMRDGSTETHELYKIHEANCWDAFLKARERKFQIVLSQNKSSKSPRSAICSFAAKKLASNPEEVAKSELVVKKRKIRSMAETKDHEVDEKVVWKIEY